MPKVKQKIYGWIDLTKEMRGWIRDQIINKGQVKLGLGWRVSPAHFRANPTTAIIQCGYPDCDDSHHYWFDSPEKRDQNHELIREPLPLKSERDKQYFKEENAQMKIIYGFNRYELFDSNKRFVEEYNPDADYVEKGGVRQYVFEDVGGVDSNVVVPQNYEPPSAPVEGLDENKRLKKGYRYEAGKVVKAGKKAEAVPA